MGLQSTAVCGPSGLFSDAAWLCRRPPLPGRVFHKQRGEREAAEIIRSIWALFIVSIRSPRLIKTIEAISEILQDLKYDSEEAE